MEINNKIKETKATKKSQLLALMSKPMGVKLTTLIENLGWQRHTTLGFISKLRKQGFNIQSIKGTNGIVYKLEKSEITKESEVKHGLENPVAPTI